MEDNMEKIEESILGKLSMPPVSQIRFPLKLWKLIHTCDSGAISWSIDGDSFIINRRIFQTEFLGRKSDTFKTQNISSLVRQLNLYGFQKVQRRPFAGISRKNWPDLLEYRHIHFRRGYPELVNLVQRRSKDEEEDRIASNNLSMYQTQEPLSHTQSLKQVGGYPSIAPKEVNSAMLEPSGLQEPVAYTQGHIHGQSTSQSMKLPLKRLSKAQVRSKKTPPTIPLKNQAGVFQFPLTVAENDLHPITLPASSDEQGASFQAIPLVYGSLYGQGSILKPITLPFGIQLLRNNVQTPQSDLSQGQETQILETDDLKEQVNQIFQTNHLQQTGAQTPQTARIYEQDDQTPQTDRIYEQDDQTDHYLKEQTPQILQINHLQKPGVQILHTEEISEKEVQILKVENLDELNVQTLTIEQIRKQYVQVLDIEHSQGQKTTFNVRAVESPITLTEKETTFTLSQQETTNVVPSQIRTMDANDVLATFYIPKHADPSSS